MPHPNKTRLRDRLRAQRRSLGPIRVQSAGAAVAARVIQMAAFHRAELFISYLPSENEIPTQPIHADILATGRPIYLPCQGGPSAFGRWRPGDVGTEGPGKVFYTLPEEPFVASGRPTLALLPLVGWNTAGARLGRGQGFYDRAFCDCSFPKTLVGLAYEFQEDDDIPDETWDIPLDCVVTERRVVVCPK